MTRKKDPAASSLDRIKQELQSHPDEFDRYFQVLKLASLGNMVGGITHTLNNILGGILGYAQLLKEIVEQSSEVFEYADVIENASKRASKVISQLQLVSHKDGSLKEIVNPRELVTEIAAILRSTFSKSIRVTTDFKHGTNAVMANTSALCHVLLNICLNCKAAMPDGGELIIKTKKAPHKVLFEITDSGKASDSKFVPYLFEPFYSNGARPDAIDGTGLGMAIAREIVLEHGGTIDVQPGKICGTKTLVALPSISQKEIDTVCEPGPKRAETAHNATILVVDDEEDLRNIARQIFELKGFDVLVAGDGSHAIEVFEDHSDKIALVLLDMILPGSDGAEVYRKIKHCKNDSRIILTSGYINNSPFQDIINKDNVSFFPKPWDLSLLVEEVETVLSQS